MRISVTEVVETLNAEVVVEFECYYSWALGRAECAVFAWEVDSYWKCFADVEVAASADSVAYSV